MRTGVKVSDLMETVARIGEERSPPLLGASTELGGLSTRRPRLHVLAQRAVLASAIGAASGMLSLLLNRDDPTPADTQRLLDDAEQALHYNRDLLQTVLDRVDQGIAAFDKELRLVCWNRLFRQHLDLPPEFGQVGTSLGEILRHLAQAGLFGAGDPDMLADRRLAEIADERRRSRERHPGTGRILTMEPRRSGDEGLALVVTDVTEQAESETELVRAKAMLEKRVASGRRSDPLTTRWRGDRRRRGGERLQDSLPRRGRPDILQPSTRRLTRRRCRNGRPAPTSGAAAISARRWTASRHLARVLDISRLDTASLKPDSRRFRCRSFSPAADRFFRAGRARDAVTIVRAAWRCTPSQLLQRILQNPSPTPSNHAGARAGRLQTQAQPCAIEVVGTASASRGRAERHLQGVSRLESGARVAPGLGLGLSIVERIARLLNVAITLDSVPGRGTRVSLSLPLAVEAPATLRRADSPGPLAATAGMVVLCIDNDEKILAGMTALLSGWGSAPIVAKHAREAVKLARAHGRLPDLLLVDYHLDEGDGWRRSPSALEAREGFRHPITADRSAELRTR